MSDIDATEATRREFEAVMATSRFATVHQLVDGLGVLAESETSRGAPAGGPSPADTTTSPLPSRLS